MTFLEALSKQNELWEANTAAGKALSDFLALHPSGPMGLTPENVKTLPEYRRLNLAQQQSHCTLRSFNGWFCKQFKAELKAHREAQRSALSAVSKTLL